MRTRPQILVIDDDPLFRCLISMSLRNEYAVTTASEGSEGFYRALDEHPDVAIIDIQMPGWNGLTTLKAFRAHPALSRTKVMILTTDCSTETLLAAIEAGADEYVIKTTFSRDELVEKLAQLLAGRTQLRPDLETDQVPAPPHPVAVATGQGPV